MIQVQTPGLIGEDNSPQPAPVNRPILVEDFITEPLNHLTVGGSIRLDDVMADLVAIDSIDTQPLELGQSVRFSTSNSTGETYPQHSFHDTKNDQVAVVQFGSGFRVPGSELRLPVLLVRH